MASGPITSWQIDGETVERVTDFILGGYKITADDDCSHEMKRRLHLGRKIMTKIDSMLKSTDITLPTKVHLVKPMVFPAVMYGYESWTIKKAECQRVDAFELWCWRRLLRVPWTERRSKLDFRIRSTRKEVSPECHWKDWCWMWNSNTLAIWCKELTHWKIPWYLERLKARGEGADRGWDGWMASQTQCTWVWVNSVIWWWTGSMLQSVGSQRIGDYWVTQLNWTELNGWKTECGFLNCLYALQSPWLFTMKARKWLFLVFL